MKVYREIYSLEDFKAWCGAKDTQRVIIEHGKGEACMELLNEIYEDLHETQLNDLLWFNSEWFYEVLDIREELEEEE